MSRVHLLAIALSFCMTITARHVPLSIVSQTPVAGAEEARSIIFDHYGLMWIGTDQGFRSYNGYRFTIHRNDAYHPNILPNNYALVIEEDQQDRLWIGTRDGLVCYNRRQGVFRTYHLQGEQGRTVNAIFVTSKGVVLVGTNNGVSRYCEEKDDFIDYNMAAGVRSFAEDEKGNIYIGTWEEGLYRLNMKSGIMVAYPRMNVRNTAQSMLVDAKGRLWIGTWEHGIIRLDNPSDEKNPGIHMVNEDRRDFRTFHHLVEDPYNHSVWGCCIEGLTRVDIDDMTDVENYSDLSFCYDIETDGEGNLWALTRNDGIVHLSTKPSPLDFHYLDPSGQVLPVNRIQTVFTNDGNLFWLGLQPYGLALYDRQTNHVRYNDLIPGLEHMTGVDSIHVQTISAFIERRKGELWMASSRGIIIYKNGEKAKLLPRYGVPFLGDGNVNTFCKLHDGTMLVGLSSGLGVSYSDTKGRQMTMNIEGRDISNSNVMAVIEDSEHHIWVATENAGIIKISGDVQKPQSLKFRQYAHEEGSYPIDDATTVYEDTHHRLWAISSSGGLFIYNAEEDRFQMVNQRYHIPPCRIYAIVGDKQERLWLSTDQGLLCLEIDAEDNGTPVFYNAEEGSEKVRFSANGLSAYGSELFFGSANGFFSFEPRKMDEWQGSEKSSLIVSALMIDDRPYEWLDSEMQKKISKEQPFYTREISIPSDFKKFSIEFALLAYQNPNQCFYSYKLEGYDNDWHQADVESRKATYQNLPAGTYQLCLKAVDSYGHQVEMPYKIKIHVLPPWYKTWWAYFIYLCVLAAIVYGISEWYKDRVNRRARLQQRVSELIHYRELMVMRQFEGARKALEAEEQQHSSPDELFIQKAIDCVKQHLSDSDYDREQFASDMCVSSSTLYNKLRSLTGQNVTAFINSIRLKEACNIVRQRPDISVTELSMEVGFNTPKYFTKLFKKEFGMLPSEFIEKGEV